MKESKIKAILNRRSVLISFLLYSLIFQSNIFAQGSGNKYSGEFLAIGVGGRPLGMFHSLMMYLQGTGIPVLLL